MDDINQNIYDEVQPYLVEKDPRELNVVERIKQVGVRTPVLLDDEDIQKLEMSQTIDTVTERNDNTYVFANSIGLPNGIAPLNSAGVIDEKYLPPTAGGSVIVASTVEEFPAVGTPSLLYLASAERRGEGHLYWYSEKENCYKLPYDELDIQIAGNSLPKDSSCVNIPVATSEFLGVVKSSEGVNYVKVTDEGMMKVDKVDLDTVVNSIDTEVFLSGGNSHMSPAVESRIYLNSMIASHGLVVNQTTLYDEVNKIIIRAYCHEDNSITKIGISDDGILYKNNSIYESALP